MNSNHKRPITTLSDLANSADYSLMDTLTADPDAEASGANHTPREVCSGHYVPVTPTPIEKPEYVTHSTRFFRELGFADDLAQSADFIKLFSGQGDRI